MGEWRMVNNTWFDPLNCLILWIYAIFFKLFMRFGYGLVHIVRKYTDTKHTRTQAHNLNFNLNLHKYKNFGCCESHLFNCLFYHNSSSIETFYFTWAHNRIRINFVYNCCQFESNVRSIAVNIFSINICNIS